MGTIDEPIEASKYTVSLRDVLVTPAILISVQDHAKKYLSYIHQVSVFLFLFRQYCSSIVFFIDFFYDYAKHCGQTMRSPSANAILVRAVF